MSANAHQFKFEDYEKLFERPTLKQSVEAMVEVWRGWCQDPKCENNRFLGGRVRIKLPKWTPSTRR